MPPFWQEGIFLEGEGERLIVKIGDRKYELTNLISEEYDPEINEYEIIFDGTRIPEPGECEQAQNNKHGQHQDPPNDVIVTLRLQMNQEERTAWEQIWTLDSAESGQDIAAQSSPVETFTGPEINKYSIELSRGIFRMFSMIFFLIPFLLDILSSYIHAICRRLIGIHKLTKITSTSDNRSE